MKLEDLRVGDRFMYKSQRESWEIIRIYDRHVDLISNHSGEQSLRYVIPTLIDNRFFEYLGNFTKSDKFIELYNLLNETSE